MNATTVSTPPPQHGQPSPVVTYGITAGVIAALMALRWRRMRRATPLKIERLWIVPAIYGVIAAITFATTPPRGFGWAFCLLALGLGAGLGWQRGKLMRITVDPATGTLNQTGSPAAMIFLVALVVVRSGARAALTGGDGLLHLDALAVTDMLIALALGLFTATRVEMYLRARRMLAAQAARA